MDYHETAIADEEAMEQVNHKESGHGNGHTGSFLSKSPCENHRIAEETRALPPGGSTMARNNPEPKNLPVPNKTPSSS